MKEREKTNIYGVGRRPSEKQIEDALAAVIASTKRKKRKLNSLEVVDKILLLAQGLGSLNEVSRRVGLSREMLRQILSVRDCSNEVKTFVKKGKLTGFDILHRLSKLSDSDQHVVAKAVLKGELSSDDVRAIVTLRRDLPHVEIGEIVDRIKASRNIKQYVVYFVVPSLGKRDRAIIRARFEQAIGARTIVSLKSEDDVGELIITGEGKKRLEEAARSKGNTKRAYVQSLIMRE